MVSFLTAKQTVAGEAFTPVRRKTPLAEAAGSVLASPVLAQRDIPGFLQSSMDGYAFRFADHAKGKPMKIVAEIAAGSAGQITLGEGEAARIFTGAPLPGGSDTVVMQEKALVERDLLRVADPALREGGHTRKAGSEIQEGALALDAQTCLSPAAVGFLAAIGVAEVTVFSQPSVAILVTGNELRQPGMPLLAGQVYDGSSFMLLAALRQMGIPDVEVTRVPDDFDVLKQQLERTLHTRDVVLVSGGVSVGAYDFGARAAAACGVTALFHGVRQRPGKPLFFGRKGNTALFGLPGNPSSTLTCFYEYVWPLLRRWSGHADELVALKVPLSHGYEKDNGLTQFLKGRFEKGRVTPLGAQESFRLHSFATANCLIVLGENQRALLAGDQVEIHLLPAYR